MLVYGPRKLVKTTGRFERRHPTFSVAAVARLSATAYQPYPIGARFASCSTLQACSAYPDQEGQVRQLGRVGNQPRMNRPFRSYRCHLLPPARGCGSSSCPTSRTCLRLLARRRLARPSRSRRPSCNVSAGSAVTTLSLTRAVEGARAAKFTS